MTRATSVPPRRRARPELIRVASLHRTPATEAPSLHRLDHYTGTAARDIPTRAMNLYETIHAYRRASDALLASLSSDPKASNTPSQQQALRQLMKATNALVATPLFWDKISQPPASLQHILNTLTSKPVPMADVQAHLVKFAGWLNKKYIELFYRHNHAVRSAQLRLPAYFRTRQAVSVLDADGDDEATVVVGGDAVSSEAASTSRESPGRKTIWYRLR